MSQHYSESESRLNDLFNIMSQLSLESSDARELPSWNDFAHSLAIVCPSQQIEFEGERPTKRWTDIGGYTSVIEKLKQSMMLATREGSTHRLGVNAPKGILLHGPSGCGKTAMALAMISESGCSVISIRSSELFSKYLGETEARLRRLFAAARAAAPCIVFIDEVDSLAARRGTRSEQIGGPELRILSTLLNEMDGIHGTSQVVVIGCTNAISQIDDAILRPGRFDQHIEVGLPDEADRAGILEILGCQSRLADNVDIVKLASSTEGFTGAALERLFREAGLSALRRNNGQEADVIEMRDFEISLSAICPPPRLGIQLYRCPYCPEYFALDIHQIDHHIRINHSSTNDDEDNDTYLACMGVKGLWTLLEPTARPVRLESLQHKRLAIDASIWLYQLLKAMTDADGNPLENAHIIGFYRRICKLLFYGIKPVFVFDGGAPELKRATIAERQEMRDRKANSAKHAAHQLLQTQLKLHALGGGNSTSPMGVQAQGNEVDDSISPTKKRKRDEYELPPLQRGILATREENERNLRMAHPDDLRQLVALASQYPESFGGTGDIDAIDVESDAFKALSPEDQHDIIVALKVRSRQTSHNRLQYMLKSSKDAMDFSKQQIELLVKRNTLTQQWLQVTGNAHRISELGQPGASNQIETSGRVASERNRQYTLIKSNEAGGGWTLKMGPTNSDAQACKNEEGADRNTTAPIITLDTNSVGSHESKGDELSDAESVDSVEFEDVPTDHPYGQSMQASTAQQPQAHSELDDVMSISTNSAASYIDEASDAELHPGAENVYSDYDYYSQSSLDQQQDGIRLQREQEEQAILSLSPPEFLDYWMRFVPQQAVGYDINIHESMRYWLLESDLVGLQDALWRANRRLDKQPDVSDMDNDPNADVLATNGQSALAAKELNHLCAKISYLTFMSSYLSFALIWRQRREHGLVLPTANQAANQAAYEQNIGPESMPIQEKSDIVSVDSDSSIESRRMEETVNLKSSSLLASHEPEPANGVNWVTAVPKQSGPGKDVVDLTEISESYHKDKQDVESRTFHDTIFEKSRRHIGVESVDLDDVGKENEAQADNAMVKVRNIDSGSEDSNDESDVVLVENTIDDIDLDLSKDERISLLRDEQNEYVRFLDKLKASSQGSAAVQTSIEASFGSMRTELQSELDVLRSRVKHNKRDASGVESDMIEDIRMMLTLFGIPYITAPMEAEAQCATLVAKSLVDGMVTDDSDSFLFAPRSERPTMVYRHFFQKDKYVEMYSTDTIHQDSSLTQCDHVFLAYLMGSDYTVGIKGIGPVLAMEALAEFGPSTDSPNADNNSDTGAESDEQKVLGSLDTFKSWCDAVLDVLPGIELPTELVDTARRRRLAQVIRKAGVSASFPDPRVARAYFDPQVDRSDSKFEWGFPRLDLLRQFLGERLGWSVEKTDETLVPLVRKIVDNVKTDEERPRQRQTTIESAFPKTAPSVEAQVVEIQKHSQRVGGAISSRKSKGKGKMGV
ncbi:DNA repair protein rad2 [Coemansia sp. RSA 1933]|nr:DNA repair protein rad2 [Coemansia sp. RSA 1933]